MTDIPVTKASEAGLPASEPEALTAQIRNLAYHLFEGRGGSGGRDLDDWLEAERELILAPGSEVVQQDGKFEIRMPAQGYEPREIHVTALPGSLVVKASVGAQRRPEDSAAAHRFAQPIDVDRTAARLDNGILYVTAIRQEREREATAV